jgi:hypothetical protein
VAQERTSPLDEGFKDPLPRLKTQLSEEFEGQPQDLIDQAAKHSLDRFKNAKVREFVPIFSWRHARRHLRSAT